MAEMASKVSTVEAMHAAEVDRLQTEAAATTLLTGGKLSKFKAKIEHLNGLIRDLRESESGLRDSLTTERERTSQLERANATLKETNAKWTIKAGQVRVRVRVRVKG